MALEMHRTSRRCQFINVSHYTYHAVVTLFVASILIFLLHDRSFPRLNSAFHLPRIYHGFQSQTTLPARENLVLDRILKNATMEDNTVILTVLNAAWAKPGSVLDQFLASFRMGDRTLRLLDHLVIVALDREAYKRCKSVHKHCLPLSTPGVDFSGNNNYMTDGYLKMVWTKIDFLRIVLQKGFNFIFTDTDVMWFRDPLPMFYLDGDFQISCDYFRGNPLDIQRNIPNSGLSYVKSNNRTIEFYKYWYTSRLRFPQKNDQHVLNLIKHDQLIHQIGLQIRFLDTAYFGGLCEKSKDFQKVCTMHVNCCIGLNRKVSDLRVMLEDWKKFTSLPPSIRNSHSGIWNVPKNCSMKPII